MSIPPLAQIRFLLSLLIAGLVVSGVTAIPLEAELRWLVEISGAAGHVESSGLARWLVRVRDALVETNARHPFISYGTDWLAFAHIVIAIAFIGPWRDPVRNVWVVEFGILACLLVVPWALILGNVRGIPLGWRLLDSAFGILGVIPLGLCRRLIRQLENANPRSPRPEV